MQGKKSTKFAEAHIEQALKRLEPGGRLVAIVGKGMADDAPSFKSWWQQIKLEYNVKANIGIEGKNYQKYGTTFGIQLLVIDKDGPTTGEVITDSVTNLEDVLSLLEGIKNARKIRTDRTIEPDPNQLRSKAPVKEGGRGTGTKSSAPVSPDNVGTGESGSPGGREPVPPQGPNELGGKNPVRAILRRRWTSFWKGPVRGNHR